MALSKDSDAGGSAPPALRRKLSPTSKDIADLFQQKPLFQQNPLFQQKPLSVEIMPKRHDVTTVSRGDYDTVMAGVWGNLENEGMAGAMKRQRGESTLDPDQRNSQIVQNVADQYNEKAKIGERDSKRLVREGADRSETAQALTPKQWAALSPLQQASAQANYDLSLAVKKDFETQGKGKSDDTRFKNYQDRVKELFGEDGSTGFKGLEYAPNTIAFLDSRGIEAANLAGRTLDDLISGDALVTADTFNSLGEQVKSPDIFHNVPADTRGQNIKFAQDLAKGQLAYQEDLASKLKQGDRLLTDITSGKTNEAATKSYGALESSTRTKFTDVRPETAAQIDKYMQALARTDIPIDQALKTISLDLNELGASTDETSQVWEGLIERSRQGVTGEGKWFDGIDFPMRSPVEVAQALGAPTLKRQATLGAK